MTDLACRASMQNSVRRRYRTPPCPVYARLPPLVRQFPLIIVAKKLLVQVLLHVSSCCATPVLRFTYRYDTPCLHRYKFHLHIPYTRALQYKDQQ
jgi:hypothetical protein